MTPRELSREPTKDAMIPRELSREPFRQAPPSEFIAGGLRSTGIGNYRLSNVQLPYEQPAGNVQTPREAVMPTPQEVLIPIMSDVVMPTADEEADSSPKKPLNTG